MGLDVSVDAGHFTDCVEIVDTNPVEGDCDVEDGDVKVYCPGIGLVIDEEAELTWYGYVDLDDDDDDDEEEFGGRLMRWWRNRD
jgi:hypothetical protein